MSTTTVDLELDAGPSAVRAWADATTVVTAYLALLYLLPARLVIGPMGAIGRPAAVLAVALACWWLLSRLVPGLGATGRQPVRTAVAVFSAAFLVSYALGFARGLTVLEASSADRFLIGMVGLLGVTLVVADGVVSRARLDALVRRLAYLGGFLAAVGATQFLTGFNLAHRIRVPGLVLNAEIIGIGDRGDTALRRVAGMASHPIELGVVLGMLLPLALHLALFAPNRRSAQVRWALVGLIVSSALFSVSRSAVITVVVAMVVLAASWTSRLRFNALVLGVGFLAVFRSLVPGLLGTLRSLFLNQANDPSVVNRKADYPIVFRYVAERPWFGRGPGTFLPEQYILLDNEFLGSLVSMGYVGSLALLLVVVVGIGCGAAVARDRRVSEADRHLGAALAAAITAGLVASFTFDSLSFPLFSGTFFVLIGLAGALWRLRERPLDGGGDARPRVLRTASRPAAVAP